MVDPRAGLNFVDPTGGSDPTETLTQEYVRAREEFDPIFYVIGLVAFVLLYWVINRDKKPAAETKKLQEEAVAAGDPKKTFFTRGQLWEEYNGKGPSKKVYLACNDTVFDVTESPHYCEGGGYAAFAGRDVSMACAFHSTEEKYLQMPYDSETARLKIDQEQNLMMFYMNFCKKYKIVGKLAKEEEPKKTQ
ncbi:hypothetical protein FGO68_gene253 [Halteria grandinella]|uniref:Cytochrome b5 heme-binding domain-containing protein n=1 Tax=Halteria grandinella TaxID=5974 RepID=A0A8J8ND24_HALGN|nr:hypothetical protein FGO68_gene253 [Halteria grandinella]